MRYAYLTLDVFTDRRFGGNQLAVLVGGASVLMMEGVLTV
jgi:predicted PhzF superfamily epimerase YddE/YHI9